MERRIFSKLLQFHVRMFARINKYTYADRIDLESETNA